MKSLKEIIYTGNISEKFFTRKKIIWMIFGGSVFLVAIFLTFYFLEINLGDIFYLLSKNNTPGMYFIMFSFLLYPIFRGIYIYFSIAPRIKCLNLNISRWEYVFLTTKMLIINAVTPFASGSEPYFIYWLKSRGVPIEKATSISLINAFLSMVAEIIITIPSFIVIAIIYPQIARSSLGVGIFWLTVGGLLLNLTFVGFYMILGFSSKTHYQISLLSNKILAMLKMKHLNKKEIYHKYMVEQTFKRSFKGELKQIKQNILLITAFSIFTITSYVSLYLGFYVLSPNELGNIYSFGLLFNVGNVAITANAFIPIPNAEFSLQVCIMTLASLISNNSNFDKDFFSSSTGLWRIMTSYLPILISILITGFYYSAKIYYIKQKHA